MTRPIAHNMNASGWADDRLMQAYDLIWEVQRDNANLSIEPEFGDLLKHVENADDVLASEQAQ